MGRSLNYGIQKKNETNPKNDTCLLDKYLVFINLESYEYKKINLPTIAKISNLSKDEEFRNGIYDIVLQPA